MRELIDLIGNNTTRGECRCGQCVDVGDAPDPTGNVVDMIFFTIGAEPTDRIKEEFVRLTRANKNWLPADVDPFDGKDHGYQELGAWIGSQTLALRYMALGKLLGVFELLTPINVMKLEPNDPLVMTAVQSGLLSIIKANGWEPGA